MSAKKGLGRGFDSLLPTEFVSEEFDPTASQDDKISELRLLPIKEVHPDENQPRREFDQEALEDLAASIKEHGILQPLVVTPEKTGYQIVAGERRWRAASLAGLSKVPAIVRTLSAQHRLELSLIENLQRQDLNPLEIATSYLKLRDQFNLKLEEISARVGGRSIAVVSNTIRLLRLPQNAKEALIKRQISEGHARQILALPDEESQTELLEGIIKKQWSVRQAEQFVIGYKRGKHEKTEKVTAHAATQSETVLTKDLSKRLNTAVKVRTTAKGGQLIIAFKDEQDLTRIIDSF